MPDDENDDDFNPEDYRDIPIPDGMVGITSWEEIPEPARTMFRVQAQAQEHARMEHEATAHAVQRLFDEMSMDHLMALAGLFNDIAAADDGRLAAYYQGVCRTFLHLKHDVCPSCGVNHEEEAMKELTGDVSPDDD